MKFMITIAILSFMMVGTSFAAGESKAKCKYIDHGDRGENAKLDGEASKPSSQRKVRSARSV